MFKSLIQFNRNVISKQIFTPRQFLLTTHIFEKGPLNLWIVSLRNCIASSFCERLTLCFKGFLCVFLYMLACSRIFLFLLIYTNNIILCLICPDQCSYFNFDQNVRFLNQDERGSRRCVYISLYFLTWVPFGTFYLLKGLNLVWSDMIWSTDVWNNTCI